MVVATISQPKSSLWSTSRFSLCNKSSLFSSSLESKPAVHQDFLPPQPWTGTTEHIQALDELQTRLASSLHGCPDDDTLKWFLRDSSFNITEAETKVKSMMSWRAKHRFVNVTLDDVLLEYQTGKAVLHPHLDQYGRPTVIVRSSKHLIGEFPLEDSKRLCTFMIDSAVRRLPSNASGVGEQLLLVVDLNHISMSNIDLMFVAFVIEKLPELFPRRIGQVLFVDAPWLFKAPWEAFKHALKKYAALVRFISSKELAEEYFTPQTLPDIFRK